MATTYNMEGHNGQSTYHIDINGPMKAYLLQTATIYEQNRCHDILHNSSCQICHGPCKLYNSLSLR